jgi:predicted RNA-binding protein with PUA-like domain
MKYWLMKSEPEVFGIEHLRRKGVSSWDGVRNYQARNNLMAMQLGDRVLFYHSNAKPNGVVGEADVVKRAYPDHTAWDTTSDYYDAKSTPDSPRWMMVDVRFLRTYPRIVTLEEIRTLPSLKDMVLVNNSRLSVQPVTPTEYQIIERLAHATASPAPDTSRAAAKHAPRRKA